MKRFKTKQELGDTVPHQTLSVLCVPYGETYYSGKHGAWDSYYFTTNPHPYEGKDIIIHNPPTNKLRKEVQERALALGFEWVSGGTELREYDTDYIIESGTMMHNPMPENYDTHTILTPRQFLEGYWPGDNCVSGKITGLTPHEKDLLKGKDIPDAYAKNGVLYVKGATGAVTDYPLLLIQDELWSYNLMSEEEFKKKHPQKLKFKEWEVKRNAGHIHVGCETLRTYDVQGFVNVIMALNKHKVGKLIDDFYKFFYIHKDELNLDFSPCPTDDR